MTVDPHALQPDRAAVAAADRHSTGVPGVDHVLDGGLLPGRNTLLRGPPGAGKTLLGLHYLTADDAATGLFVNMGEPAAEVRADAASFGFDLDAVTVLDLTPEADAFRAAEPYDVFPAFEVEGPEITERIADAVHDDPDRVFIDPLTQLRYLVGDTHQFRKQVLGLLRLLDDATVVFTSQATETTPDDDLQFLSDAVLALDQTGSHRTLQVTKFRGSDFRRGSHSMRITDDGVVVSPTLDPGRHRHEFTADTLAFGVPELDELVGGGLERGTVTMLTGPTGVGKTTTGLQFVSEAARRGTRSVLYSFEESEVTIRRRADAVGIQLDRADDLVVHEIGPREYTVDEFGQRVRHDVERGNADVVMIDAVAGYRHHLRGGDGVQPLVDLGRYLRNVGVTAIVVNEQHSVTGDFRATEEAVSHVADNVVFLRHIEFRGELHKIIGVLKKRAGDFERSLREVEITEDGLDVGEPLSGLRGVLTGTPTWTGGGDPES